MFDIGDKAVYPGHGVGVIEAIEWSNRSYREQGNIGDGAIILYLKDT